MDNANVGRLAGEKASELGHKILLDPVGVGASTLRTNTALELIDHIHFDVIRGNILEIKTLALGNGQVKGVDASSIDTVTMENLEESLIHIVSDGKTSYIIRNRRSEMGRITGTGCQLSGMMSAYLAANPEHLLEAAMTSVCAMGVAGEIALKHMRKEDGNATYRNRIIDAIYHLEGTINKMMPMICYIVRVPISGFMEKELIIQIHMEQGVHFQVR